MYSITYINGPHSLLVSIVNQNSHTRNAIDMQALLGLDEAKCMFLQWSGFCLRAAVVRIDGPAKTRFCHTINETSTSTRSHRIYDRSIPKKSLRYSSLQS